MDYVIGRSQHLRCVKGDGVASSSFTSQAPLHLIINVAHHAMIFMLDVDVPPLF